MYPITRGPQVEDNVDPAEEEEKNWSESIMGERMQEVPH